MARLMDVIKKRISVRSYSDEICEESKLKELMDFIGSRCSAGPFGNVIRFKLVEAADYDLEELKKLGTYGMIRGARLYLAGAAIAGGRCMEDFGYCMETAILKASELGIGTCWLGGSLDRGAFGLKIGLKNGEIIPAVTPLGYASDKRTQEDQTVRARVDADSRKNFDELFLGADRKPLERKSLGKYEDSLEAVRLAPSASNKQPWRVIYEGSKKSFHFYLDEDYNYNNRFKDIKLQNIDMGIAMCHFESVSRESGLIGKWKTGLPGIDAGELIYIVSWVGE